MMVLSFGGGLNTTAVLAGLYLRGIGLDATVFADTGGELPHTYRHIEEMSEWCVRHGYPPIITVRNSGETLEQNCLRRKALPAIAYGYRTCSQRWKLDPFEKWANNNPQIRAEWLAGRRVEKLIGYDADEPHRVKDYNDDRWVVSYPLIEWDMGRDECVDLIRSVGLEPPGKSACFFCPNRSDSEFRQMREAYPEYLDLAIAMEENAELTSIKGLKRDYTLRQLLANEDLFGYTPNIPCGCTR